MTRRESLGNIGYNVWLYEEGSKFNQTVISDGLFHELVEIYILNNCYGYFVGCLNLNIFLIIEE